MCLICYRLSFCDLAGSERYTRTKSTGDRLKEAANINTSLLTLGRCIQLLRQNQTSKYVSHPTHVAHSEYMKLIFATGILKVNIAKLTSYS